MGKLVFICGTMGAGKSAKALELKDALEGLGTYVHLLKLSVAQRPGEEGRVFSRNGKSAYAIDIDCTFDLLEGLAPFFLGDDAVIIDEAQFLIRSQVDDLRMIADSFKADVYCFGLRTDFRGTLFPASGRLLELADEIRVLRTPCSCGCGRAAVVSAKIDADGHVLARPSGTFEPGDIGRYQPMCAQCFEEAKASSFAEVKGRHAPSASKLKEAV